LFQILYLGCKATSSGKLPKLARLAKVNLYVMATSVQSERNFSEAGQVISQPRVALSTSRINDILLINSNRP